jgi:P4 family phage/plasmid primase-like protien
MDSFVALKSRKRLKGVVERARELLCVGDDFFKPKSHLLPLNNGILDLSSNKPIPFNPALPLKEKLPVNFVPNAECDLFLNTFLRHVLSEQDIDLLQRYLGQLLDGHNHSQTILMLNGESGWGKSTLIKILTAVLGLSNVGIIRDQVFKSEKELSNYLGKRFLLHPDMPADFLDRREASLFKQLVGGDPLWAEDHQGNLITIEGNFPCILCCNGKPKIKIDSDDEAWMRRLLVIPFGQAQHDLHVGRLAEVIVRNEGPAILNWLVEGRRKLMKANFQMSQTSEQQRRTTALVMACESPKAFVKTCLERKQGAEMVGADLYAHYQHWCLQNQVIPFAGQYFNQMAKDEIEITLGLRYRHDLKTEDGTMVRGWKNLALAKSETLEAENASKVSG